MSATKGQGVALRKLRRAFYRRDAAVVAQALLGKYLVHQGRGGPRIGRIVEVEAYLGPQDRASHSFHGLTPRTRVMFGPPGHAYVYLVYGMHHCLNVVTGRMGQGAAVLLRALEPVRNLQGRTSGPGLLCRARGVDLRRNAQDLCGPDLYIAAPPRAAAAAIVRRPRVGVGYAGAWARRRLRFYLRGNPFVSKP